MRTLARWTCAIAAAAALAAATPAHAGPGNGIRFGAGRVHPFLEVEGRWDSNVLLEPAGELADLTIHVRPGLRFAADGEKLAVKFDGAIDVVRYLGLDGDTTDLSRVDAMAGLDLELNRRGVVGLELEERFSRGDRARSLSLGNSVISNVNALRVGIPWRPGGALTLSAGGEWVLETFEEYVTGDASIADLGYDEIRGSAEARWRFLPRTSALVRALWQQRLPRDETVSLELSGLKVLAGATGLVTPHFAGTVEAGYGDTFESADEPFSTWLANLEAEWIATEKVRAKVGWSHGFDFDPGITTALFESDAVWAEARALLRGDRLALALRATWDHLDYVLADGTTAIVRVSPTAEWKASRWLRIGAGYAYTSRSSTGDVATFETFEYDKNEVWLTAGIVY